MWVSSNWAGFALFGDKIGSIMRGRSDPSYKKFQKSVICHMAACSGTFTYCLHWGEENIQLGKEQKYVMLIQLMVVVGMKYCMWEWSTVFSALLKSSIVCHSTFFLESSLPSSFFCLPPLLLSPLLLSHCKTELSLQSASQQWRITLLLFFPDALQNNRIGMNWEVKTPIDNLSFFSGPLLETFYTFFVVTVHISHKKTNVLFCNTDSHTSSCISPASNVFKSNSTWKA